MGIFFNKKGAVTSQASFGTIFAKSKKAIGPVVATALLLVVAVGSVAMFQGWFQTYQSGFLSDLEIQSNSGYGSLTIEGVYGDKLYVKNKIVDNLSITSIKIGGVECNLTGQDTLILGVTEINISSCVNSSTPVVTNILLLTQNKIVDKTVMLKDQTSTTQTYSNCTLDSITKNHNENYTFYNTSIVAFGDTCSGYSLIRVCNDGTYTGDTSYNVSSCSVTGQDTMPDTFIFTDVVGVEFSTITTSNTLTPIGYDGTLSIGITGPGSPELSVAGGSFVTSGNISVGENLTIRLNSSANELTSSVVNLTIGDYSTLWNVTTRALASCSLDGTNLNSGQSYSFFNTSAGSTCYSSSRTCTDGTIGGDVSYQYSSCTVWANSLSCTTDTDGDGQINSSCAVYPMENTNYEGDLDVNDLNSTIKVNMSCIFNNDKSGCLNQYVIDGCGTDTVLDIGTNLCWDRNFNRGGTQTWDNAKLYCTNLNTHPSGHTDWYLPTRQEFETLVDLTRTAPHIAGGNTIFTSVINNYYWTKTTYGPSTTTAFRVSLDYGYSYYGDKTNYYYVACLRRN